MREADGSGTVAMRRSLSFKCKEKPFGDFKVGEIFVLIQLFKSSLFLLCRECSGKDGHSWVQAGILSS